MYKHNAYIILGINQKSSNKEIKLAYKTKLKENHPDHGGDTESTIIINDAYSILIDKNEREKHDTYWGLDNDNGSIQYEVLAAESTRINVFHIIRNQIKKEQNKRTDISRLSNTQKIELKYLRREKKWLFIGLVEMVISIGVLFFPNVRILGLPVYNLFFISLFGFLNVKNSLTTRINGKVYFTFSPKAVKAINTIQENEKKENIENLESMIYKYKSIISQYYYSPNQVSINDLKLFGFISGYKKSIYNEKHNIIMFIDNSGCDVIIPVEQIAKRGIKNIEYELTELANYYECSFRDIYVLKSGSERLDIGARYRQIYSSIVRSTLMKAESGDIYIPNSVDPIEHIEENIANYLKRI